MYELSEPVSKSALYFTPFTFIIATGYVTLVLVVTNIGSGLLLTNLSQIYVWCLFLHFKQVLALRHVFSPCTVETKFFTAQYFSTFSRGFYSFTISRSMVRFLTVHTFILSLFSQVTFAIAITFFLDFVYHSMVQDFSQSTSLGPLPIAEISSPASCHHFSHNPLKYPAVFLVQLSHIHSYLLFFPLYLILVHYIVIFLRIF